MLTKPAFASIRFAHISMAFAGLMWVLPFLNFRHVQPIPGFYQEWSAALLGLLAMLLLVARRFWQQPEIPRIALLPIGLSLLVLIQFAAGRVAYLDQALLFTLYMLWAALLALLGHHLREELGLPVLCTALAACLLLGAELNALIGLYQHYSWCTHPDYLFLNYLKLNNFSGNLAGSLGQPNHFANYITLGLVSLGLLQLRWQLRVWQMVLLAAPLLFVLTLSGSRSPWLYLLCMAAMSFLWQRCDKSCLPLLYYSLTLLLGFGLMHFVVQIPWLAGCSSGLTSGERLIVAAGSYAKGDGSDGSGRLHIWRGAWLIFTQLPLLGAGFGQFAWQHFQLGPVLHNTNDSGLIDNAHNLLLQVAAEMGLAGLLILLGALALWFWQARSAPRTVYHWWGYGLLAVLAIHSLLEYPLWYAYFLGVAALTLGMFDTTTYRLKLGGERPLLNPPPGGEEAIVPSPTGITSDLAGVVGQPSRMASSSIRGLRLTGRFSVAAMLLLGGLSLSQLLYLYHYGDFETSAGTIHASATDNSYAQRVRTRHVYDHMLTIQGRTLLLQPYFERLLGSTGWWDHIADRGALNGRVMHYMPSSPVVYRQALLLARLGQQAEARVQIERAIWAYPEDFPATRDKLRAWADRDATPSRYVNLLEFALQKYEERQRVIPAIP